jgi:hypothetical protein
LVLEGFDLVLQLDVALSFDGDLPQSLGQPLVELQKQRFG